MSWALINADNSWAGGPFAVIPAPGKGQRVVPIPLGYPATVSWSQPKAGFVDLMTEAQCLALIDAQAGALRSAVETTATGMADVYRRKMAEVTGLNSLGATSAAILSALKVMTASQQQASYPFLYADMQASGSTSLVASRDRIAAAAVAGNAPLAAIEKTRIAAKIAVRTATTLAAKTAAATAVVWPS